MSVQRNRDDEQLACQYRGRVKDVRVMHAVAPDTHSGKTYPSHGSVALAVRIARGNVLPTRDLLQTSNAQFKCGRRRTATCTSPMGTGDSVSFDRQPPPTAIDALIGRGRRHLDGIMTHWP